jgi:hypothetical protein
MRRREFITLVGGTAVGWPLSARAQQSERVRRIGVLSTGDDAEGRARLEVFAQALNQLGWSDGRNLRIDVRYATASDINRQAAELVSLDRQPARLANELRVLNDRRLLERDPEEEPQRRYGVIENGRMRAALGQMQLIASDILEASPIGRTAEEHGEVFDGSDVALLGLRR